MIFLQNDFKCKKNSQLLPTQPALATSTSVNNFYILFLIITSVIVVII